ncbi:magnesium transporter [Alkalibacter saccharofermentans]|uniref:Magnesium transporter MgtE n=1 Tax=Alkalibacter saccharofermentans DSM 14828 TaxID=1120975 RepID=A0A1M4XMY4_9FIRM|nr:magnesium transporter [Alkalibacter saccharofermentans]SHE94780.1 magnesium transporter [Alkalibacter saccharofermentans DSM 14828]
MKKLLELLKEKKFKDLRIHISTLHAPDIAEAMAEVSQKESLLIFRLLPKDLAVEVFSHMEPSYQVEFSQLINEDELKELVNELNFDDKIDYLEEIPANLVKKILQNTPENERRLINQFLNYPEYSAGSIMTIEFVDLKKRMTVREAINRIRKIGVDKETIYTCYVTDNERKLEGIISLKELILSSEDSKVEAIMNKEFISVETHDNQEDVADKFLKYDLLAMPVVDSENRLVGIITVDDIMDVMEEETTKDFHMMAGMQISEESYLESTVAGLFKKRFPWLAVLMISATFTSAIMEHYQALIASMAILSANIPMLMGTSGNAGAQASTLMVRSIAVGDVEFRDLFSIIWKELRVSFLIGLSLAFLNFIRMYIIGNYTFLLSFVVSLTLIATITLAKLIGSALPMFAKRIGLDPAIMANPMISTILDALVLITYFTITSLFFHF